MTDNAPGWQPDPTGRHEHRYWDGSRWTENVANGGVSATDPYEAATDAMAVTEPPANPYETPVTADPNAPGAWDDPTQVTPAPPADPTATFATATPPAPPAYTPPSPVSGDGPGGGSKKGFFIGLGVLAAVALAVIAFLALGGDDDDTDPIASGDSTTTTADDETDDTEADDATTTTESDEDPFGEGGELGELPDDFEEQMADIYESQMGLSREQAECLANRMGEVVRSGEMTEEDAFGDIMSYLSDCDISMEDLAGN